MSSNASKTPDVQRTNKPGRFFRPAEHDNDPFYVLATSPFADENSLVLKQGETFAVFDHCGDIKPGGLGEEGIYHGGTRFLSCLLLKLGADRPLFLSSTVKEENDLLVVDLTNPDVRQGSAIAVDRGTVHIGRTKFLWDGVCHECLRIRNYGQAPVEIALSLHFEADYADIFEVRGSRRPRRGHYLDPVFENDSVVLGYEGLDGAIRRTRLEFAPAPAELSETEARFQLSLPPQAEAIQYFTLLCDASTCRSRLSYDAALGKTTAAWTSSRAEGCTIRTPDPQFNDWVNRALADLHMMTTNTAHGPYPYAGVPWFSTVFGRDGIITALECLWGNPSLARGVLSYLAATQASERNPRADAEPGKILHETRQGEMAALGEIPFGRYYGSVDATPLFIWLAAAYYERTCDHALLDSIWPNIERALDWMDTSGDVDRDGFVEYQGQLPQGLVHQGWKDSRDSIFHADGALAKGAIALCEVQGYVYAAKCGAAELADALGHAERAAELRGQATALQQRFERAFWCEELATYALALDGNKHPCRVRTSNAGHCLLTGIVSPEHARRVARTLLAPESFSGWGVRTVAEGEARYNPMSYHNGSVWPHDNALVARGLARYGFKESALRILSALFDASRFLDLHRMPELFCGFGRRSGEGPTLYPVACSPQSWSAASVFLLLQACLGLTVYACPPRLCFSYPLLPEFLEEVRLSGLRVGDALVDLLLVRHGQDVGINVLRRDGQVEIRMVK